VSGRKGVGGLSSKVVGCLSVGVVARGFVCVVVLVVCGGGSVADGVWAQSGLCSNEQRRAEQTFGLGLADCRAFEMVSPLAKDDSGVTAVGSRAAVLGGAVAFFAPGSFAEPKSALLESRYLSVRETGGWSTRNVSPPFTGEKADTFGRVFAQSLFTPDLSSGVTESWFTPLVAGQPVGYVNLYVMDIETGSYEAVTTVTPVAEYKPYEEGKEGALGALVPEAEGASVDLSHVVFQQRASLCCGASPKQVHVYEWAGGSLRLIDVPPEGGKLEGEDNVGSAASVAQPNTGGNPWRAVSGDGSHVVFTGGENLRISKGEFEGQVYVRVNPMSLVEGCSVAGDACTVEVSKSERTPEDPNAGKNPSNPPVAWYRDASVDGSRMFFTSKVELTNDAFTGSEDNAANLYEYDFNKPEGKRLADLTVDEADPDGAGVLGLVTASEDGSYVYFVAEGRLTSEQNGEEEVPVAGKPNLYLSQEGKVTFIATLAPRSSGEFSKSHGGNGDEEDWVGGEGPPNLSDFGPGQHSARVSAGGSVLVFLSELGLTRGFDHGAAAPGECENERCREVYLFDAVTGKLVCVSCDPSGAQPVGSAAFSGGGLTRVATGEEPFYLPRNLSDGGGRVFFQSPDALVRGDSNGRVDVYEWERPGEGSCTTASVSYVVGSEGCVFPVSDVAGGSDSWFMDASGSGDDVFIATGDQLVPSDTDSREDVYDVRVGGGFPVVGVPGVCVSADECKPPVSGQPGVFGVPASASFSGPGNLVSAAATPPVVVAGGGSGRLVRALGVCRRKHGKKRKVCEKRARKANGAKTSKKSGKSGSGGSGKVRGGAW
jgi:hypothetical protein